jgi:hypothetical protein
MQSVKILTLGLLLVATAKLRVYSQLDQRDLWMSSVEFEQPEERHCRFSVDPKQDCVWRQLSRSRVHPRQNQDRTVSASRAYSRQQ